MPPPLASPSIGPLDDDQWLEEPDALLFIEKVAASAPSIAAGQAVSPASSSSSNEDVHPCEDGDEEHKLMSKIPDRRQAYRMRKRCEVQELRAKSAELQTQLNELQQRQKTQVGLTSASKRSITGWRGVAMRQMQRRLAAKAFNRELRMHIRQQHQAAVSLIEELRAQAAFARSSRMVKLTCGERAMPFMQLSEKDVWDMSLLLQDIDSVCAQASFKVQRVHIELLEADETCTSKHSRDVCEASGMQRATQVGTTVIPFPVADTISTFDEAFRVMISDECVPVISNVTPDGSTVAAKFLWGPFEILSVSKTIKDKQQATTGWRSIIRERSKASGHCIEGQGWEVAVAADEVASTTRLNFLSHWKAVQLQPNEDGIVGPYADPLDRYAQMQAGDSGTEEDDIVEIVENLLMDDMAKRKTTSI